MSIVISLKSIPEGRYLPWCGWACHLTTGRLSSSRLRSSLRHSEGLARLGTEIGGSGGFREGTSDSVTGRAKEEEETPRALEASGLQGARGRAACRLLQQHLRAPRLCTETVSHRLVQTPRLGSPRCSNVFCAEPKSSTVTSTHRPSASPHVTPSCGCPPTPEGGIPCLLAALPHFLPFF